MQSKVRRLQILLRREGYIVNHKRLFRLDREEKLSVRRRGQRKRAIGTRALMLIPMAPHNADPSPGCAAHLTDGLQ